MDKLFIYRDNSNIFIGPGMSLWNAKGRLPVTGCAFISEICWSLRVPVAKSNTPSPSDPFPPS